MPAGGKRNGRILILIALVFILVVVAVAFYFYFFYKPKPVGQVVSTPTPSFEMANVVILTQPITMGEIFKETMLSTIQYPKEKMVEGLFFTEIKQVIGKQAKFPLEAGVVLNRGLISDVSVGSVAGLSIPRGYVAISIPISRMTSVSYALRPGDHVNVIAAMMLVDVDPNFQSKLPNNTAAITTAGKTATGVTTGSMTIVGGGPTSAEGRGELDPVLNQPIYVVPSETQRPRLVSQTLVQDAIVLWVGEFPLTTLKSSESTQPTPTPIPPQGSQATPVPPVVPTIITLIVSPQDSVTLNYMMLAGASLNLALRSAGDNQKLQTEAATLQFVMDQYNIPLPAKLPYGYEVRKDTLEYPVLTVP